MKKLVALPALIAVSLGVAACAKHDDGTNASLANDVTLNSDEVLTDENAAAFDANATDLNATDLGTANTADLSGNAVAGGNTF